MSGQKETSAERKGAPWTFDELAARSAQALAIFDRRGIRVHRDSALSQALAKASQLSRIMADPRAGNAERVSILIDAGYANRVAVAVLATEGDDDPATRQCLERMAKGMKSGAARSPSQGKDAMWELDMLARLRRLGLTARLQEPDIVCDFGFGDYAIACKRLHGVRTLPAKVREGANQIRKSGMSGLVAIEMDNLVPHYATVVGASDEDVERRVASLLEDIHRRHQPSFQKYLFEGRCDAVLACVNVHTDIETAHPRFSSLSQMLAWTIAESPRDVRTRLVYVRQVLTASVA